MLGTPVKVPVEITLDDIVLVDNVLVVITPLRKARIVESVGASTAAKTPVQARTCARHGDFTNQVADTSDTPRQSVDCHKAKKSQATVRDNSVCIGF